MLEELSGHCVTPLERTLKSSHLVPFANSVQYPFVAIILSHGHSQSYESFQQITKPGVVLGTHDKAWFLNINYLALYIKYVYHI